MSEPVRASASPATAPPATAPGSAQGAYRWYILVLAALTHTLVVGMPMMSLPVLFEEIGADLSLNLVQIGYVWGASSLLGIAMSLTGGVVGDRIGARRMLVFACLLTGVTGATRAFASDYASLTATVLIAGLFPMAAPMNVHKTCGVWFSGKHLGMANGVVSAGMALGFLLGSLISATFLSPLLGGWRNVLLFYAVLAVIVGVLWAFTRSEPTSDGQAAAPTERLSLRDSLLRVGRLRNVWLLAVAMFGIGGAIQGSLGYLPLYLRNEGWEPGAADSALASFHFASLLFTLPLTMLSDRLGRRRPLLLVAALMITVGFGLLSDRPGNFYLAGRHLRGHHAGRLHGDFDDAYYRIAGDWSGLCRHGHRRDHSHFSHRRCRCSTDREQAGSDRCGCALSLLGGAGPGRLGRADCRARGAPKPELIATVDAVALQGQGQRVCRNPMPWAKFHTTCHPLASVAILDRNCMEPCNVGYFTGLGWKGREPAVARS